jgi:hypothetical protein
VSPCQALRSALNVLLPLNALRMLVTLDTSQYQGLTLFHFSARLEPFLAQENTLHTLHTP